ncbi:MAG: carboxypeptidase regulatory-like domain-containing protein [Acidobacteria bacterium]|nr:carboxypeptidase regulatory-like domain-containing protein [Acidobacteriota bacterium]
MKTLFLLAAFVCLSGWSTNITAQERGAITGRVVSETGKPLVNIHVNLSYPGQGTSRSTTTDTEGRFQFTGLQNQTYSVTVSPAQGYLLKPMPAEDRNRRYRPGDSQTFTLVKGGVITGRVTDPEGNPVISIPISLFRVVDERGNKSIYPVYGVPRTTDDRGVYRIYGLQPGTYIVAANPNSTNGGLSQFSPYIGQMPTYHPSATRDTATEVKIDYGTEASGIDIRFRAETGRTISGKVIGGGLTINNAANVSLTNAANDAPIVSDFARSVGDQHGFSFPGIPDGEYLLTATLNKPDTDEFFSSEPRRITVKGADITGLALSLSPLATITGTVVLEKSATVCDAKLATAIRDVTLLTRLTPQNGVASRFPIRNVPAGEKGEFKITHLTAGQHHLRASLRNENWFVKSIHAAPTGLGRSSIVADLVRNGVMLKPGERLTGVTIAVSDGAAGINGKLAAAREGDKLPQRVRVHLIPAEPTTTNDVLRHYELTTTTGIFGFGNVAPGKYWLLAKPLPDEAPSSLPMPVAWDAVERARLRKEAEAAKTEIELKPCQRLKDFVLRF